MINTWGMMRLVVDLLPGKQGFRSRLVNGFDAISVLVTQLYPTLFNPCQALLSIGVSRQEYWSGLPFPSPGDLPSPGSKPGSPALQVDSLPSELPGKPHFPPCTYLLQISLSKQFSPRSQGKEY